MTRKTSCNGFHRGKTGATAPARKQSTYTADKPAHEHSIREITPIYDEKKQLYQSENTARKRGTKGKNYIQSLSIHYNQSNQSYKSGSFQKNSQMT